MGLSLMGLPAPVKRSMSLVSPGKLTVAALVIAVLAYLPSLHYPFISDDLVYVIRNPRLSGLQFANLWHLLVEPYNDFSEFLPVRDLSYWFDLKLHGLNPAWYRLHNILLYLLCLPLVYFNTSAIWRYFRPADPASASWVAAIVTLLFTLHPAHVEAVVWISGRKDVLACLFSLLALWLALKAQREPSLAVRYAVAALVCMLAAILSKATAVAMAPVIALLWLFFWIDNPAHARRTSGLFWPLASLLVAGMAAAVFTAGSMVKDEIYLGSETVTRMFAIVGGLARLSISPESRHFYYPVFEDTYLEFRIAIGIVILFFAAGSLVFAWRKRSLAGFALTVFSLLCMPYAQLIPFDTDSLISDRFICLAVWPAMLLVVAAIWRLRPLLRIILLSLFALVWGMQTVQRVNDWRSYETLIDADLRTYPGYYMPAVYKITSYLLPQGRYADAEKIAAGIKSPEFRDIMIKLVRVDQVVHSGHGSPEGLQQGDVLLKELENGISLAPVQTGWNPSMKNLWIKLPSLLAAERIALNAQYARMGKGSESGKPREGEIRKSGKAL